MKNIKELNKRQLYKYLFIAVFACFTVFVIVKQSLKGVDGNNTSVIANEVDKKEFHRPKLEESVPSRDEEIEINPDNSKIVEPANEVVEVAGPVDEVVEVVEVAGPVDEVVEVVEVAGPVDEAVEVAVEVAGSVDEAVEVAGPVDEAVEVAGSVDEAVEVAKPVEESIAQTLPNTVQELKKIKKDIKIIGDSFEFKGKKYFIGDNFGIFKVLKISPKKIRFKKSKEYYYSLRFF